MQQLQTWLSGKKTHLVCLSAIIAAVAGYAEGALTLVEVVTAIFAATGAATMRAGVEKSK